MNLTQDQILRLIGKMQLQIEAQGIIIEQLQNQLIKLENEKQKTEEENNGK